MTRVFNLNFRLGSCATVACLRQAPTTEYRATAAQWAAQWAPMLMRQVRRVRAFLGGPVKRHQQRDRRTVVGRLDVMPPVCQRPAANVAAAASG